MTATANPNATKEVKAVLEYLENIRGKGLITGLHTQTRVQEELLFIEKETGKLPALCGFELLAYSPNINWESCDEECLKELRENEGQIKEQIGVVFDSMNLPELLRGKDVGKVLGPLYQSWDQTAFNGYLERFSLPKNKLIKDYSRGMKMKVAIAAALSHRAKLLLLDEATGGLDPIVRDEILDILLEFMQNPTHGILFSSHITGDLEKIADYVTFIHEGQVRFSQPKDELLDSYAVVKCSPQQLASIDPAALISVRSHQYGTEALVRRDAVWADAVAERPTIEDMMLFIARGNR